MRRDVLAFVVTLVLGVSGVATAAVFAGTGSPSGGPPGQSDKAEANEKDGAGTAEHALEHMAAGQAHAGKADDSGSDAAGS